MLAQLLIQGLIRYTLLLAILFTVAVYLWDWGMVFNAALLNYMNDHKDWAIGVWLYAHFAALLTGAYSFLVSLIAIFTKSQSWRLAAGSIILLGFCAVTIPLLVLAFWLSSGY